ncbi:MAG: lytic transglycosylase domain-containing protein [Piscinibacter sp.]|nr:lytic transglycosylase domain-containing protein [Piscinibacter sp.]
MQFVLERADSLFAMVVAATEAERLPMEIALLPVVESAYKEDAKSSANASGLWQIMPETARDLELIGKQGEDLRWDARASTGAALKHLRRLYERFENWHLALAAYNCGESCVERALDNARRAGASTRFQDLRLPEETRHYVPRLIAIRNLINGQEWGRGELFLPPDLNLTPSGSGGCDPVRVTPGLRRIRSQNYGAGLSRRFVEVTSSPMSAPIDSAAHAQCLLGIKRALHPSRSVS